MPRNPGTPPTGPEQLSFLLGLTECQLLLIHPAYQLLTLDLSLPYSSSMASPWTFSRAFKFSMAVSVNCFALCGILMHLLMVEEVWSFDQLIPAATAAPLAGFIGSFILIRIKPELYDKFLLRVIAVFFSYAITGFFHLFIYLITGVKLLAIDYSSGIGSWILFQCKPELLYEVWWRMKVIFASMMFGVMGFCLIKILSSFSESAVFTKQEISVAAGPIAILIFLLSTLFLLQKPELRDKISFIRFDNAPLPPRNDEPSNLAGSP